MRNTFKLQVGRRGVITFPKELRDQNNIKDGDILTLIEVTAGIYVISSRHSQVDAAADDLARQWQDSGESLETMLSALREIRADYDDQQD